MKHYGDITKLSGHNLPIVDVITGGSPCQDLSVAGKRAGLAGERSGLFMEQIRLIKEMRDECVRQLQMQGATFDIRCVRPRYMVWENVPGAFSSNKGEDFRAVLEETAKVAKGDASIPGPPGGKWPHAGCIMGDGWSIAWRVHDAQFWGVPQRRKRIALVADFGGDTAPEILFERESMSGNITESGKEGEGAAPDIKRGIDPSSYTLKIRGGVERDSAGKKAGKGPLVQTELSATLGVSQDQTLIAFEPRANAGDNQQAVVQVEMEVSVRKYEVDKARLIECLQAHKKYTPQEIADKLGIPKTMAEHWFRKDSYFSIPEPEIWPQLKDLLGIETDEFDKAIMTFETKGGNYDTRNRIHVGDVAPTLNTQSENTLYMTKVYGISAYESNAMKSANPHSGVYEADTARTLDLNGGSPACNQGGMAVVCLEGNGSRPSHQGDGWHEGDPMFTLNSTEHHAVCVENHPQDSRVKIREDGICQTLDARMGMGGGNVPMVMEQPITASKASYFMKQHDDGVAETLVATDYKDPQLIAYGLDRAAYNQGQNAKFGFSVDEEKVGAQTAKGPGAVCSAVDCRNGVEDADKNGSLQNRSSNNINSNNVCRVGSVVRRLTPLECERLQGFPVVRKVRFTEMTKDEYIAWNINEGNIVVNTEYGKVFTTRGPGGVKLDEPKELTGSIVNGYRVVSIRNGDTKMQCRVHRIVWIAERGVIPDGYVIDHINNDKQDNRRCNLQLLTAAENSKKAREDGLYKIHGDSGSAKITDEVHDFIQYVYGNTDLSIRQLAEFFGISKSRVQQIIHDEPWTDIGEWTDTKGKKHKDADSPRYKALGNSIALPFWQWMAERMVRLLKNEEPGVIPTMASLFDGIGGFPLSFSIWGCEPVWASEIEEFPMAVTKIRFPDID